MNRPYDIRGRMIRRALLAVVRRCAERDLLLPTTAQLGRALAIDASQVCRHLNRVLAEAGFRVEPEGRYRRRVVADRNSDRRLAA
jgi:hypothetical protein